MLQDLKHAARSYRNTPGFAVIAVLTLALGIGANTAIFSVVDAVLLRQLPYRDPDRIVMVWESHPELGGFLAQRMPVALKNFLAWKQQSRSLEGWTAFQIGNMNLTGREKPERLRSAVTSTDFFNLLGVNASLGRVFSANEGEPGHNRVVVLSHGLFERALGGDRSKIGSTVAIDGKNFTVIGVLPPEFHLPAFWEGLNFDKPELWLPLNTSPNQPASELAGNINYVFARLRPGASVGQARAEMKVIAAALVRQDKNQDPSGSATVFPLRAEDVGPELRRNVLILQLAVGFVLLISCANIANLLLTRATGREREMAIRVALGAGRGRLMLQMLSENALLTLAGGALGLALGYGGMRLIGALAPEDVHNLHELALDPMVLLYTAAVVLLTSVLFGLAPSLAASAGNVQESLSHGGRAGIGGRSRLKSALVVSEVALALMLLIAAGLMIRSLSSVMGTNPGFHPEGLLTMRIDLPQNRYPKTEDAIAFDQQLMDSMQALPGVQSVAMASGLPMQNISVTSFKIEGAPATQQLNNGSGPVTDFQFVTDNYFSTMGSRILRGRSFTQAEAHDTEPHVTVINEALAKTYWNGQDPLGKAVLMPRNGKDHRLAIIGVVENSHQLELDAPARAELYEPARGFSSGSVVLRVASGDPSRLAPAITRAVAALDKDLPVTDILTYDHIVRESTAERRFHMGLLSVFALLALLLAGIGLYGVLAYSVAQRTREIGIRVALGAQTGGILRMVVREGLLLAGIGIVIGIFGAFGATQLMRSVIFGVTATDPLTFAIVALALALVAVCSSLLPARRAARVDPMEALRIE